MLGLDVISSSAWVSAGPSWYQWCICCLGIVIGSPVCKDTIAIDKKKEKNRVDISSFCVSPIFCTISSCRKPSLFVFFSYFLWKFRISIEEKSQDSKKLDISKKKYGRSSRKCFESWQNIRGTGCFNRMLPDSYYDYVSYCQGGFVLPESGLVCCRNLRPLDQFCEALMFYMGYCFAGWQIFYIC